jgi:hypothetical protein
MKPPSDYEILTAMTTYGGGFVNALAHAARKADLDNLRRIKAAFPEYWQQYAAMVPQPEKSEDEIMNDRCRNNPNDTEASDWVYRNLK